MKKRKLTIYDVEVSPTKAMVGFKDHKTGEISQFDSSEGQSIGKYIKKRILIGFNNLNYDDLILSAMMLGATPKEIYEISVDIIENGATRWNYRRLQLDHTIDIMEVAKGAAALKLYGARLNTKKLQDLPYDPHVKHTKKMWKNVCEYNKNDLTITEELYEFLKPQLKIRKNIGATYGIDVMSRSDAQVAEDVFKVVLGIKKKPSIDKPSSVKYKAPGYIKFKSKSLKALVKKFESTTYDINLKTGKFIGQEWLKEKVVVNGVDYTIGYGGLHSNEKSMMVEGKIKNADIASMYPSLIINSGKYPKQLGKEWLKIYTEFRDDRMVIKHTNKDLSAMLKIFLNGSYGKLNSVYSILYAPHLMLDTTITGQLSLLMVIEALGNGGKQVISANTDGVEYIDDTNEGEEIIDKLGEDMNLVWEHAAYEGLYARDVNSYIAVYSDHTKRKGFYSDFKIDKNNEYPIVTKAISMFLYDNQVSIEDTIRDCTDPAMFCVSRQVTGGAVWSPKDYENTSEYEDYIKRVPFKQNKALEKRNDVFKRDFVLLEANQWYLGKVVRFYYSKKGKPMFYKKSGNRVPKSDGSKPMMDLKKKVPKDLDYDKYVNLANIHLKETGWIK